MVRCSIHFISFCSPWLLKTLFLSIQSFICFYLLRTMWCKKGNVPDTEPYSPKCLLKTNVSEDPFSLRTLIAHWTPFALSSLLTRTVKSRWGGIPVRLQFTSICLFPPNDKGITRHFSISMVWALTFTVQISCSALAVTCGCSSVNWGGPAGVKKFG